MSEYRHARQEKREFCRLLRKEVSSKYNVRRYDRVLTTNELKCNKRADSNAIIGRRKLGKSKKLLRFTQAHLHKFIQLIKVYPLNYVIIYQFLANLGNFEAIQIKNINPKINSSHLDYIYLRQ